MMQRRQIDVARRLAARAFDFEPRIAAMDGWSTVGEGSIGSPTLPIRSFQLWQARLSARRISSTPLAAQLGRLPRQQPSSSWLPVRYVQLVSSSLRPPPSRCCAGHTA